MRRFILLMISNGDQVSSKRVIAVIAFILMTISYSYGIITETKIPEYMWEGFLFIVLAAFFGNVVEKFRRKGTDSGYNPYDQDHTQYYQDPNPQQCDDDVNHDDQTEDDGN